MSDAQRIDPASGEREPLSDWLEKRGKQPTIADLRYYEARMKTAEAALAAREDTERSGHQWKDPVLVEKAMDAYLSVTRPHGGHVNKAGIEAALRVVFNELGPTLDEAASLLRELADDVKWFYDPKKLKIALAAVECVCAELLGRPVEQGDGPVEMPEGDTTAEALNRRYGQGDSDDD